MARYVQINDGISMSRFVVPKHAKTAYAEFTLRGEDGPCLRHDPASLDRGELVFAWDTNARSLRAGWYVISLVVDGCKCGEHLAHIDNGCTSQFIGDDLRNDCYECDGLPKADVKCRSTVLKKDCCVTELCPRPASSAPAVYVPDYEVPDAG